MQCNKFRNYSKTCLKRPLEIDKTKVEMENGCLIKVESIVCFVALNPKSTAVVMAGLSVHRKYCRMLPLEHSAICKTCLKR